MKKVQQKRAKRPLEERIGNVDPRKRELLRLIKVNGRDADATHYALEALGWVFADEHGLIGAIGSREWRRRVAAGEVSEMAIACLEEHGYDGGGAS